MWRVGDHACKRIKITWTDLRPGSAAVADAGGGAGSRLQFGLEVGEAAALVGGEAFAQVAGDEALGDLGEDELVDLGLGVQLAERRVVELEAAAQVGFRLVYFHASHLFLLSEVFVVCRFSALFRSRLMACCLRPHTLC